jgi:hypothetical protein
LHQITRMTELIRAISVSIAHGGEGVFKHIFLARSLTLGHAHMAPFPFLH